MKPANVRLQLAFDLELSVPDALAGERPDVLQAKLAEALGAMVLQGLPTIAAKQLGKAAVQVVSSRHGLATSVLAAGAGVARAELVAAAPHLTDAELDRLAARSADKLPPAGAERERGLRRQALAMVGEFRLVPCVVHAVLTSEQPGTLDASLNLTNGSVMIEAHDRQKRLLPGQSAVSVDVPSIGVKLGGSYAGHTISGPVIEVTVSELSRHRDALVALWQQQDG